MQGPEDIQGYLDDVAQQIRWWRARPVVLAELRRHLEDQRDAFAQEGRLEEAERLAVEEMGDPVEVGLELDRVHRPRPQWGLLALTGILALAGAGLRVWLTAGWSDYHLDQDPLLTALALLLGCGALLGGYFLDAGWLARRARWIYVGALLACVLVTWSSPQIANIPYYARYVTLWYPLVYALWLYDCRGQGWMGLLRGIAGVVPLALSCIGACHLLSLGMLQAGALALLLLAAWNDWFGIGRWKTAVLPLLCAGGMTAAALYLALRSRRLAIALHPELDPQGGGYLGLSIRKALESAQWLGEGTWDADAYPFAMMVPSCDSDALPLTLIHRLGWLPFLAVVLAFAALVVWMLLRGLRHGSQLGKAIALAVVTTLALQAAFSVVWNLGCPLVSAPFPLLVGDIYTVLDMGLIGLALSVFRGERAMGDLTDRGAWMPRYRVRLVVEKCP